MKIFNTMFLILCVSSTLHAAYLDESYTIVIPKPGNDTILNHFDNDAAKLFAKGMKETANLILPIVTEDRYNGSKAVFIGNTNAAQKQGINPGILPFQACAVQTDSNGNLYFSGRHSVNPEYMQMNSHQFRELGTLRGICEFLRIYAGMRIFLPNAIYFTKKERFEFPDHIKAIYEPVFSYVHGTSSGNSFYDTANGFLFAPWNKTYGGHSHEHAVPTSLFQTNPEYFMMLKNGKRWKSRQLCLSNLEVQELIYKEMLKNLDKGFQWVQLGQVDAFSPCLCKSCKNLCHLSDWGEKMWILHKTMAERLKKDRPDKKVVILCYWPNNKPPKTFKEFPDNVLIELCRYSEKELLEWKNIKVPGGFIAYVYNWGAYQLEGYTPRFTPEKAVEQIKQLKKYGIRAIFRCGFGEMYGLEGPCYYAYGAAINDPESANAEKFVNDYCDTLYGNAATLMKQFYHTLYDCQKLTLSSKHYDYHVNIAGLMPAGYANHRLLSLRYPEKTLDLLDNLLKQAVQSEPTNQYIKLVRREFDFLAVTAKMCSTFCKYISFPSIETFKAMKHGVNTRDLYLKNTAQIRGHMTFVAGVRVLGGIQIKDLRNGGSWKGKFVYPINWDLTWMEKEQILPGARKLTCNTSAQKLMPALFGPVKEKMIQVSAEEENDGLHINLIDHAILKEDMYYIILEDTYYVFRCTYRNADIYEKKKNGAMKLKSGVDKSITKIIRDGDRIRCFIPWSLFPKGKPQKGESLLFNVYVFKGKQRTKYVFEPDIYIKNGQSKFAEGRAQLCF